ncbi:MAG: Asp-tRNA(Asn)/Glu-tRNA(Gln) amidotransferase subunit GatA [Patescibacteria group bacterium]|nr:Asp-tRNA(Asn)/Glu-tRNA(Gln) amidotransferase subunit GatA [Patescibacteria group bacterium]
MISLRDLTLKNFHEKLVKKEFLALEIAQAFFKYIKETDQKINAYVNLLEEDALKDAERVDLLIQKGEDLPPLAGVPLAIKDVILIKGHLATASSKMLENYRASYDSTVIKKLKEQNAVFLGKTNLDEFAMGSSTENSAFKTTKNPYDLERVPGGSSGGSAAAVAAHIAVASLGSDTGGSIRQPAGFCGIVGLKPTYGAVSRYGLMAMASSLDQIGPMTKTVEDASILFSAIAGGDKMDATSQNINYGEELLNPDFKKVKNLTVGLPEEFFAKGIDKTVSAGLDQVIKEIESLGLKIKKISLPHAKYALSCYYIIMPAEVSANLAKFDGLRYSPVNGVDRKNLDLSELYKQNRSVGFGEEVKRRAILGTFVLSSGYYDAYYNKAQKVRSLIKKDFDEAFKTVDVILSPVSPTPPFKIGEKTDDPLEMYLSDIFTIPINLAGVPAISIPVNNWNKISPLPLGFQLIGKHFREVDILGLGRYYEELK